MHRNFSLFGGVGGWVRAQNICLLVLSHNTVSQDARNGVCAGGKSKYGGGGVHMPPVPLGSYTYGVFTINLDSIYFGSRTELQSTITFGCGFESIRTGGCSHLRRILVNVD